MQRLLLATLLLATPVQAGDSVAVGTPADAVRVALADCQRLPADTAAHVRYFSAYAETDRKAVAVLGRVLSYHVNSLSREAEIVLPVLVSHGLWRVDVRDYDWDRKVFEKLAGVEPYFHARVTSDTTRQVTEIKKEVRRVYYYGGTAYEDRVVEVPVTRTIHEKKVVVGAAPWLPTAEVTQLVLLTHSEVPLCRADWFITYTGIQKDRVAGYYDFLGLGKKEADFQALVGADIKLARKVRKEMAASVARSSVTLNNRGLERFGSVTGAYWRSQDYKTSVGKQNAVRLLDGDTEPPVGDASEQYGSLPNGLYAFWLKNDKDERQDTAPDFIASDSKATGTDRRVHIGMSCVRCHVEGIRPIDDWARRVYRTPVRLASPDYSKLKRLRQLYLSDLARQVLRDQEDYAVAVARATGGWTLAQNAREYGALWERFVDRDLTRADFARDLGVTEARLVTALTAYAALGAADPLLAGLVADPPVELRREHAEEVYQLAQAVLAEHHERGGK